MAHDFFYDVDHPLPDTGSRLQPARLEQRPLREALIEAHEAALKDFGGPHVEYHHPQCPKWLTRGVKACRCGAAPLEAIFEDALAEGR